MIRLLFGGSPCTKWSIAQKSGRETLPQGIGWELFLNYKIALEKFKPDYFLYENNKSMAPAIRAKITEELGVEPILINSALVSAQNRERLYWTNIPGVEQPQDKGILLRDILDGGVSLRDKGYTLKANYAKASAANVAGCHYGAPMAAVPVNVTSTGKSQCVRATYYKDGIRNLVGNTVDRRTCVAAPVRIGTIENAASTPEFDSAPYRVYSPDGKGVTLKGEAGGVGAKTGLYAVPTSDNGRSCPVYEVRNGKITINGKQYPIRLADGFYVIRKLSVAECKRLQTVPEEYTFPVSDTQAYKMLGNGWTVDVIAHILSYCPRITSELVDVLSMYDGMACGHIALDKLGAKIEQYRATEIDKYAIKTACHNFPDIEQIGDAYQVREWEG